MSCLSPIRLENYEPKCLYCEKPDSFCALVYNGVGLRACDEHESLASRDVKAWLHRNKVILWEDALKEPLFTDTDILSKIIYVQRSSGIVENGWRLCEPNQLVPACMYYEGTGTWDFLAIKGSLRRGVSTTELKMSLHIDHQVYADAFRQKAISGFYLREHEEYERVSTVFEDPTCLK